MDVPYRHNLFDVCNMSFGIGQRQENRGARHDQARGHDHTGPAQADKFRRLWRQMGLF